MKTVTFYDSKNRLELSVSDAKTICLEIMGRDDLTLNRGSTIALNKDDIDELIHELLRLKKQL
tara:strand:+ start:2559 stop:2747 length:189 start_codon:yes stop_codon:yes gene_type:complete